MRLKLFLVITITAFMQVLNSVVTRAESSQIERITIDRNLASSLALSHKIEPDGDRLDRKIVRVKPKSRKPTSSPQPQPINPPTTAPDAPKQVIISDIIIKTEQGQLEPTLEAKIRQALTVKVGQSVTREQLEQNLNAVKALGDFSTVEIIPEDTTTGVKISFLVKPYSTLTQVQIRTLPANSSSVLTSAAIEEIFKPQYGNKLNAIELKAAIERLNQLYQQQGYNLAQVVDVEELNPDGKLTLVIAEGVIEAVQVQFLNKEGAVVDEQKKPFSGNTRPFIITREAELKPGKIFNRNTAEKDLRRIYGLGLFDDVRVSFAPGSDPAKVILQLNVIERKTISLFPSGGFSSTNGFLASVNFSTQNLGGNNQKLSAEAQVGARDTIFDLNFSDPWIATDPNRTSYSVNAFRRQSLSSIFDGGKTPVFVTGTTDAPRILRQGGGITFNRPLDGDPFNGSTLRGSLGLQYQRVSVRDFGGGAIVPKDSQGNDLSFIRTGEDDLLMLQLGLTQDVRNSFSDPTQGSLLKLGVDQSVPVGTGKILMTKVRGSFTQYVPVKLINFNPGSQSLLFNLQGGTILGDLPPYEAFSLGGTSGVRGYEEGDVGSGRSYVQVTAEYRFPIVSFLGLGIFADYGTDLGTGSSVPGNPAGVRSKPGSGFGYGAGLRVLQTPIGPVRLDYALNDRNETRIQFGLGERF
ncbi:BamA/TamA family outer membrane protein [Chamaesiphon sp.]|uniref:BamA/TamA family outer membrane protein n=1 Tax=Chamaesiphon sp. TaxID=2814140 RepID=UPI0035936E25